MTFLVVLHFFYNYATRNVNTFQFTKERLFYIITSIISEVLTYEYSIDVIAIFDYQDNITPSYVCLEDKKHKLIDHKITQVKPQQHNKYVGIFTIDFTCKLDDGHEINLSLLFIYNPPDHPPGGFLFN